MPARLHSTLRSLAKRALAPVSRALRWRVEWMVEAEVARRLDAAVERALAARVAEVNERIAPALNQLASTNAVLRGTGRAVAELATRAGELEQRAAELEGRVAAAERASGRRLTLTTDKAASDDSTARPDTAPVSARIEGTRR